MMPRITRSRLAVLSEVKIIEVGSGVAVVVSVDWVWVTVISNTWGSACTRVLEFDTSVKFRDDMACSIMA